MDRAVELAHLAEAEKRLALGEQHIARQERLVAELDRDGHDTKEAFALLTTFRKLQAQHVAHRDLILSALERAPRPPGAPIYRPGHYEGPSANSEQA